MERCEMMSNLKRDVAETSVRIGNIVPSSNTVLEPIMAQIAMDVGDVSVHFSRLCVTEITLEEKGLRQFDIAKFVSAAQLLAEARTDVIAWNGTSGSWLGLDHDRSICDAITRETGIPSTTSTLAFHELLPRLGVTRVGLITPYTLDVQSKLMETWSGSGITCVSERHLGLSENFAFQQVGGPELRRMADAVAEQECEAIVIVCTNVRGALFAAELEERLKIPVIDSVSVTMRACLDIANYAFVDAPRWGVILRQQDETLSRTRSVSALAAD
jgi:maleate isomerase